jgi:hypothetical protein
MTAPLGIGAFPVPRGTCRALLREPVPKWMHGEVTPGLASDGVGRHERGSACDLDPRGVMGGASGRRHVPGSSVGEGSLG